MINDNMINGLAGALNGEAFTIPAVMLFSSDVVAASGTATSIAGVLDYDDLTNSRSINVTKFTGIRSGTAASASGDYINTLGLLTSSSGGDLMAMATVSSLLHTTDFDLEVDWEMTVSRG